MTGADQPVAIGFMPLTDCAPLVVAHEMGFANEEGLELRLVRETSWATIRDRLSVGHLDAAHALAPMPIASNLGLGPLPSRLIAPIALGFGGNTITVSKDVWAALEGGGARADFDAKAALVAMALLVQRRRAASAPKLVFGIVHPFSAHHYELAYWLAAGGIMPERDVELIVLPPSLMVPALVAGRIDGFCAGEPWGSLAVEEKAGRIVTTKAHVWRSSPEKVLAVREEWAEAEAASLERLLRAVYRACLWCDEVDNREALADLLARKDYVGRPASAILPGLRRVLTAPDGGKLEVAGLLNFSARCSTFPWISHALWLYTQMVRWGQVTRSQAHETLVRGTFRPDLYRAALGPINAPLPGANAKVEGALSGEISVGAVRGSVTLGPDGFFDGRVFDPDELARYLDELMAADAQSGAVMTRSAS